MSAAREYARLARDAGRQVKQLDNRLSVAVDLLMEVVEEWDDSKGVDSKGVTPDTVSNIRDFLDTPA